MKRLLVLLVLVAVPLMAGTVTRTATFDRGDLLISQQNGLDVVQLRGGAGLVQPGAPLVPRLVQRVLVPAGAEPTGVELVSADWTTIDGHHSLALSQPDVPLPMPGKTFKTHNYAPDQAVYSSNAYYPASCVRLLESGTLAGFRMASVELRPVRVNPVTGELQFATRIEYRVSYTAGSSNATVPSAEQREYYAGMLRAMVANTGDIQRFEPSIQQARTLSLPSGHYEYVVISAPPMDTCFNRLTAWKTLTGVPATTVLLSYITSNYSGYDTQEKIRNFIKDAYQNWGTRYVLLGGSANRRTSGENIIPTRLCWYITTGVGDYNDEDTIPCDLYYGGLDGNWDANGNHTYGETGDAADMVSEVIVGRAPVHTVAQAQNFVNKTLTYEQNPPTGYIKKMLLPAAILWSSYDERPVQESIARMTPSGWIDAKLYERSSNLSEGAMCDSMNSGYNLGNWIGHGNETGIYKGSSPYLNSSDADGLTNGTKQGVFCSIACFTGAWDEVSGGDCFSEHLINRAGGGVVGIAMNSRYGWGSPPDPGPSDLLDTLFMSRILNHTEYHGGEALAFSRSYWAGYVDNSQMMRWCIYELNYHGDPELSVWTDVPSTLTATHSDTTFVGQNVPFSVTVNSGGAPVESANVVLWKGSEVYVTGRTNGSGQVTLCISPQTAGQMLMSVNAHNYYVLQDTVQVIVPLRYVSYLRSSVYDPAPGGNNDSILNPGENVQIPTWIRNWGVQTANSVYGTLRTHNPNVQITDSVRSFGNIPAGDSVSTGTNGFGLHVDSGLPSGYQSPCSLYCRDTLGSTWITLVTFSVGAPVLSKRAVTVVDTAHGGNKNGRLDPNETADLMVRIANTGTGHGYNSHAVLRSGDSRLTVLDSTASYGLIRVGDSASNPADRFTVHADRSIFPETPIPCTLRYYADGGYTKAEPFTIVVGQSGANDPIPDGPRMPSRYYAYDDVDSLYAAHPTYNWVEVNTVGTQIPFTNDSAVVAVSLPAQFGPLKFYGQRSTQISVSADGWICPGNHTAPFNENGPLPHTGDAPGMICANWVALYPLIGSNGAGHVYYYHDAANHRFVVEYDSVRYYWDLNRDKFEIVIYDTTNATYTGDNAILVQYMTASGYAGSTVGIEDPTDTIGIQDLYNGTYNKAAAPIAAGRAILYTTDLPALNVSEGSGPAGIPLRLALAVRPNPLRSHTAIEYAVPASGRVSIKIYDASGRVVRDLLGENMAAGRYSVTWDRSAANGKRVAEGVYFCKLATPAGTRQQKLVVYK
ncbi:MAG TPA: C25 family cysteine peptidase [bacterium]|nr:C25 family cysteine peptidase [bacterium]